MSRCSVSIAERRSVQRSRSMRDKRHRSAEITYKRIDMYCACKTSQRSRLRCTVRRRRLRVPSGGGGKLSKRSPRHRVRRQPPADGAPFGLYPFVTPDARDGRAPTLRGDHETDSPLGRHTCTEASRLRTTTFPRRCRLDVDATAVLSRRRYVASPSMPLMSHSA